MLFTNQFSDVVSLMSCIKNYIQHLLTEECQQNKSDFFNKTISFIDILETIYTSFVSTFSSNLISYLRHMLAAILNTVCITSWYNISAFLFGSLLSAPSTYTDILKQLETDVPKLQGSVIDLQHFIENSLQQKEPFKGLSEFRFQLMEQDWRAMLMLINITHTKLDTLVMFAQRKARKHIEFFDTASLTIGVLCAGRFLWSLWEGNGYDHIISSGLWTVCVGMSSLILQVPSQRTRQIICHIGSNRKYISELERMFRYKFDGPDTISTNNVFLSPSSGTLI